MVSKMLTSLVCESGVLLPLQPRDLCMEEHTSFSLGDARQVSIRIILFRTRYFKYVCTCMHSPGCSFLVEKKGKQFIEDSNLLPANRDVRFENRNLHSNSYSVLVCQQRNKTCQLQGLAGWAGDETRGVDRGRILPWSWGWKSWPGHCDKTQSNNIFCWISRWVVSTVIGMFWTGKTSNNRPWLHTLSKLKVNSFLKSIFCQDLPWLRFPERKKRPKG